MGTWNKPPKNSPWDKGTPPPDIDELLNNLQNKFKIGMPKKGGLTLILIVFCNTKFLNLMFHEVKIPSSL